LSAAKENGRKKSAMEKKKFLTSFFTSKTNFFLNFFFLFLIENCAKFKMQKEKSRKINFYMGKKTAKWSLVILSALVIYTAPTVTYPFLGYPCRYSLFPGWFMCRSIRFPMMV
jgi:hypothetical protein